MSGFSDEERALIALHLAGLRGHGWSCSRALELLAQGLPAGNSQRTLQAAAQALSRGERISPGNDPLLALLAQADAAGPESLLESVKASRLAAAARRAFRQALFVLSGSTLAFALLGYLAVALLERWKPLWIGLPLPALTQGLFDLVGRVGFHGPGLIAVLAVAMWWIPQRWMPGVRQFRAASQLRQFAAFLDAGVSPQEVLAGAYPSLGQGPFHSRGLDLPEPARRLGAHLLEREGDAAAFRWVAQQLEVSAAAQSRRWMGLAPVLGLGAMVLVGTPLLVAMFLLPVFSIAGAIQ